MSRRFNFPNLPRWQWVKEGGASGSSPHDRSPPIGSPWTARRRRAGSPFWERHAKRAALAGRCGTSGAEAANLRSTPLPGISRASGPSFTRIRPGGPVVGHLFCRRDRRFTGAIRLFTKAPDSPMQYHERPLARTATAGIVDAHCRAALRTPLEEGSPRSFQALGRCTPQPQPHFIRGLRGRPMRLNAGSC
jgi:hypothetical protein